MKMRELDNPFTVTTPEDMSAKDATELFVSVFTDFPKIPREGHVFIHGPRGCGKSMIFRYLQPDCQCLARKCNTVDLEYYSIYVPIKNTDLNLTEFQRLQDKHASIILNEHIMTITITLIALESLLESPVKEELEGDNNNLLEQINNFASNIFVGLLKDCGWLPDEQSSFDNCSVAKEYVQEMRAICHKLSRQFRNYLKSLFRPEGVSYNGPLCGYLDFLFPLLRELRNLPFMPEGPIFLLIDDADDLSLDQTKILNSWYLLEQAARSA